MQELLFMKLSPLSLLLPITLVACSGSDAPATDNSGGDNFAPPTHPILANDHSADIDLSRGDYRCYTMATSFGDVSLAIDEKYAPTTAENFHTYVSAGFYDGLLFHRVIDNFMVQAGGFEPGLYKPETLTPIENESRNGLKNYRGRIAMARTAEPHSATSQFYINVVDNHGLNFQNDTWGYAVFGGVLSGMDVIDQIKQVEVGSVGGFSDVPVEDVLITGITETDCPNN